ncbi:MULTISPECIES: amino acid ABC transporter permease [Cetobacterium]|uniref:amino acid ABC transporter permease n=2 Tax=Fusobacteriaceae TaxID=203492 RepID=UPI001F06E63E|nr:amino acid ABC transporter permease [Cetobacterium somerae]MCX3067232.1 amino acid ABC transporter permease [Cetobacterium somerae]UPO97976.1 amino acid ABC transporter permease [Cetobacterium somerae]
MENNLFYILQGLTLTLKLYFFTLILSLPLGILLSLGRVSKNKILNVGIQIYTWIFRGTPLLLQLFFVYYGLPVFGVVLEPFHAALITFTINYAAYISEIFRGSILGVDSGQFEAAQVLGYSYWQTMFKIILPQSLITALPALSNEAIALIKDTSLVSAIGMAEILRNSKEIVTREFTITPFIICAGIYLGLSTVIILILKNIEKKVTI